MSKEKIEQTKKAAMVFFFAVAAFLSAWYKFVSPLEKPFHKTLNQTAKGTKATIVIDPGHGGFDPGKVGANQTLEKDVNLVIDIAPDEAQNLLALIELLLGQWYVARHEEEELYQKISSLDLSKQDSRDPK